MKAKLAEDGREASTQRRMMMANGHPGVEVDDAAIRRGENPYTKYYQQQGEQQLPSDTQVCQQHLLLQVYLTLSSPNLYVINNLHDYRRPIKKNPRSSIPDGFDFTKSGGSYQVHTGQWSNQVGMRSIRSLNHKEKSR